MYVCLQIITPVPQIVPSVCCDTGETTSHDGSEDITVKDEEGFRAEVGEGPEAISFPEIKAENEVSFTTTVCTHVCCDVNFLVCMTVFHWLLIIFPHALCYLHFCGTFLVYDNFHIILCHFKIHEISY